MGTADQFSLAICNSLAAICNANIWAGFANRTMLNAMLLGATRVSVQNVVASIAGRTSVTDIIS